MVWVKIKEKFHGKTNPTPLWKKYRSEHEARSEARSWNSMNNRDHLTILRVSKEKPTGLKEKGHGIYHQTKTTVVRKAKPRRSSGTGFNSLW